VKIINVLFKILACFFLAAALSAKTGIIEEESHFSTPIIRVMEEKAGILHERYSLRYGPDGELFLDPYIIPHLGQVEGKRVLDAGCGALPYSMLAAENGAHVHAIDIQPQILMKAHDEIKKAKLDNLMTLELGDVSELAFPDNYFDLALSINVGSHLPSTTTIEMMNGRTKVTGLGQHLKELARVLKPQATAILVAPASLDVLFTNGEEASKVEEQISDALAAIGSGEDITSIKTHLKRAHAVHRATFAQREGKLELITDEGALIPGEEIWRKVSTIAITNRYHPEVEYMEAISDAGLTIQRIKRPTFSSEGERTSYNKQDLNLPTLGKEYLTSHPFVIFFLIKEG
jgi:2-polyprenyl-3-methyl-5-hydroxy-6-metoxy-1,4-benzoquinol methylase